jgi:hypothetical protein
MVRKDMMTLKKKTLEGVVDDLISLSLSDFRILVLIYKQFIYPCLTIIIYQPMKQMNIII